MALALAASVQAQNDALHSGTNYSNYYITNGTESGGLNLLSDGAGNGSFDGGTYTYTIGANCAFTFNEWYGEETHRYKGFVSPSGNYGILMPRANVDHAMLLSAYVKLGTGKTNASFQGDYYTSYYRYTSSSNHYAGLFRVYADGVDSCIYHFLYGTGAPEVEGFDYEVSSEGNITVYNQLADPVMAGGLSAANNVFLYASQVEGFTAIGFGMEVPNTYNLEALEGTYKAMQIRYSDDYGEESTTFLTLTLYADSTGTYAVDTNSHGESATGTLRAVGQTDGVWEIVLDNNPAQNLFCVINPDERVMTGYFNHNGSPGILFAIDNNTPATEQFTVSGSVSGANGVVVSWSGDVSGSDTLDAGESYSFVIGMGQDVTLTASKAGYRFTPASYVLTDIDDIQENLDFVAHPINGLNADQVLEGGIYPNPVHDRLVVQVQCRSEIQLLDGCGRPLLVTQVDAEIPKSLDLSDFPQGMYFIRILNDGGSTLSKVLKQ